MTRKLIYVAAAILVAGCGGRQAARQSDMVGMQPFPQVQVPAMIEDRDEAMEYAALHYFDKLTDTSRKGLCDSVTVVSVARGEVEQAVSSWCYLLDNLPLQTSRKAAARLFHRAEACEREDSSSNVFETLVSLVDNYLYDPNSPVRNEDIYQSFVQAKLASDAYTDEQKQGFSETVRRCGLNQTGTRASDFYFSDRNGNTGHLYGVKAETTILFFSNPGCHACKEIIDAIKSRPEMEEMIGAGELAVVNVYIDEDLGEWYGYMGEYPESWYNVYDPNLVIRNDLLYNVRAIPSLYLLGRDKTVLLKDTTAEKLLAAVFGY
ncbi:MAG: DUF5106 domain-containing protein [Candidatus Cryptobacteroides sp.]